MQKPKSHKEFTDLEFEKLFSKADLDPELFTHEAHLRLAWIHISKYGLQQAEENVSNQIRAFVSKLGAEDKYNHTVTIAAIRAMNHFMLRTNRSDFSKFMIEHPRLLTHFKDLLLSHYKTNIFTSEKAKKEFIYPELIPF